jgi:hypothetical protein
MYESLKEYRDEGWGKGVGAGAIWPEVDEGWENKMFV